MDQIAISLTKDAALRVYTAVTTGLTTAAQALHHSYPVATAALGRTLTAAAIMGVMQKNENASITIQVKGDGPLGTIIAVSDAKGTVKGYASNPDVELPLREDGKLDVGRGVGKNGFVNVVRDTGAGEPYSGHVALVSGEIAEDLTSYFAVSEQIPTAMGLGVLVGPEGIPRAAGGFLIQMMPGFGYDDEKTISRIEKTLKDMPSVTEMICAGLSADDMAGRLLDGLAYDVLECRAPRYQCDCSRERVERALVSIGAKDLGELVSSGENTHVDCSFCDQSYDFTPGALEKLMKKAKKF